MEIWVGMASVSGGVSSAIGFGLHVAVLELPLVVGLQQHGADQADDGALVGKDADNIGAPFDLLVQPFQRVCADGSCCGAATGKSMCASTSASLSSMNAPSFGHLARNWSATWRRASGWRSGDRAG